MIRPLRPEGLWTAIFAAVLADCVAPSMPPDRVAPVAAGAPSAVPASESAATARLANTPAASPVPGGGERIADKSPRTPEAAPSPLDNGTASVGSRAAALFGKWTVTGDRCPDVCAMDDAESRAWRGRVFTIGPSTVSSDLAECTHATLSFKDMTVREFYQDYRFDPGALGLDPDHLSSVGVFCADAPWEARGSGYLWDGKALFVMWDGVYFSLKRAP
jgi:hypothetical protein